MLHILTTSIRDLSAAEFGLRYDYKEPNTLVLIRDLGIRRWIAELDDQCRRWQDCD